MLTTLPDTQLSVTEARTRIMRELAPIMEVERVGIRDSLGRILAKDIFAPFDVPPYTNSAMDGYAIQGIDLLLEKPRAFTVIGTALAGKPYQGSVGTNETVQIMTGAVMPTGADTVLMQEHVQWNADTVRLLPEYVPRYTKNQNTQGHNVRQAGEDLAKDALVLRAGKRILPADLGLLASLGIGKVDVKRRLRVAFFCTGNELRSIGEPLEKGSIYDSNRYTLYGMLSQSGIQIHDLGVVADEHPAIRDTLIKASAISDVIIATGGVSVGEADHVKAVLGELGQVHFWKIAMKPGHPLAFGQIESTQFFGLPGNPVAVMVSFYQFVQFALAHIAGEYDPQPVPTQRVPCLSHLPKKIGRTEFVRGILESNSKGQLTVRKTGNQGSGILHSMSLANCFIVLLQEQADIEPGTLVEVQIFKGMI